MNSTHDGHHRHLVGARIVCSCGERMGLVTNDHTPTDADVCEICHERGVLAADVPRSAFRIPEPEPYPSWQPMSAEEASQAEHRRARRDDGVSLGT